MTNSANAEIDVGKEACPGVTYISDPNDPNVDSPRNLMLDRYAQIGIRFYDPCADTRQTTQQSQTALEDGSVVAWIGGKTAQLATSTITERTKIPAENIYASAEYTYASGEKTAVDILNELIDQNKLSKYLILSLGQDEAISTEVFTKQIEEIETKIASARTIIIATQYDLNNDYANLNNNIRALVDKYGNLIVADWETFVKESPRKNDIFEADGATLTTYGQQQWVKLIYSSIPGNSSQQSNRSNESIIWNYFADEQNSELSKSLGAIAGLIANIDALSNSNPFYRDAITGRFGLFASKDEELLQILKESNLDQYWNQNPDFATREKAIIIELDYYTGKYNNQDNRIVKNYNEYVASYDINTSSPTQYNNVDDYAKYYASIARISGVEIHGDSNYALGARKTSLQNVANKAQKIFLANAGTKQNTIASQALADQSENPTNSAMNHTPLWHDGWITNGFIGYHQDRADSSNYRIKDAAFAQSFDTIINEKRGANKITLYSTERSFNSPDEILEFYDGRPPHFTVDLKNHKTYQHLSINNPATAFGKNNRITGIQIAIIGQSTGPETSYESGYYADEDWEYLGRLLYLIAAEIGLETETGNFSNFALSLEAYKEYEGIVLANNLPFAANGDFSKVGQNLKNGFDQGYLYYGNISSHQDL